VESKRIMITGSSGMIGTRLCEKLIEKKYNIICIDRRNNSWNSQINKSTIKINLLDRDKVLDLELDDIDLIIHLAANARVYNLVIDPLQAQENIQTTFNILEFARINKIKRIIFSSSREIYGNSCENPHAEKFIDIDNCESPYAASKLSCESLIISYHKCYGIDFTILRLSNVYGMYDETDRVIPNFIRQAYQNKNLIVFGDKIADFTYIDDTIDGIIMSIEKYHKSKNTSFNIAYGQGVSIISIAEQIISYFNSDSKILVMENRTGELLKYIADISKAKTILNYDPKTSIREGVCKTIDWYLKNKKY
jgi:nucleoside-diphosphate-sugar epimerase